LMILGDTCTRGCRFCAVKSGNPHGKIDKEEPEKVASAIDELNINYAVLTSVDRDDLPDGGAEHYANTISAIKKRRPDVIVEALIPDFQGMEDSIKKIVDAEPEVIGHNIETVEALTQKVRDRRAGYRQSLNVLKTVKKQNPKIYTKSSLLLGFGEGKDDVTQALIDLREADVDILTIGQYLRPSKLHIPVEEYLTPEKFEEYKTSAKELGFLYIASGPLVRSSYRAGEFFIEALTNKKKEAAANGRKSLQDNRS